MATSAIPTKANLVKHPMAVIELTCSAKNPEEVVHLFEWFDEQKQVDAYLELLTEGVSAEIEENPQDYHLFATVTDTKEMTVTDIVAMHADTAEAKAYCEQWTQQVAADTTLLMVQPKATSTKKVEKQPEKVERTVKGRKPSAAAAAAAAKPEEPEEAPKRGAAATSKAAEVKAKIASKAAPAKSAAAKKAAPAKAAASVNSLVRPTAPRRRGVRKPV